MLDYQNGNIKWWNADDQDHMVFRHRINGIRVTSVPGQEIGEIGGEIGGQ